MQKENKKQRIVKLTESTDKKLRQISAMENLNMSEMVEFLIENYELGLKPHEKLKKLQNDREQFKEKLEEIDTQISKTNQEIAMNEEWKEETTQKKQNAINSIRRALLQNRKEDAERFAKNQATITGIPATELLIEAYKKAKI